MYAVSFLGVMVALGLVDTWWSLLAVTTATMPLFLFSARFFPISSYGSWAWVVQLSPLYHGVALVRAANAGIWTASVLGHIAVLVTLSAVALVTAARRIDSLLRK